MSQSPNHSYSHLSLQLPYVPWVNKPSNLELQEIVVRQPSSPDFQTYSTGIFQQVGLPKPSQELWLHRLFLTTQEIQCRFDPLTKLPNRRHVTEYLNDLLERPYADPATVFFLDLNRFKTVNDSLGHQVGDQLLQEVASRLTECFHNDIVARFEGDAFVILTPKAHSEDDIIKTVQKIQGNFNAPIQLEGQSFITSACIGVVLDISSYETAHTILRDAEIAVHLAKKNALSIYQIFDQDMFAKVSAQFHMETELREAIKERQFYNEYQPIMNLHTGKIDGFEALVRWTHPTHGKRNPGEFIPLAEERGFILPIGQQVLEMACSTMKDWLLLSQNASGADPLTVSVNFSAKQLIQSHTINEIMWFLQYFDLEPKHLKVEITESTLMTHKEAALKTLFALKDLGVTIALDDFGTGYSSLGYLHNFPIDQIKLDRTFIWQLDEDPKHIKLLEAIIKMAHTLDLDVVAEGIETESQLNTLKQLNCDYAQGYYFSRPVSANKAEQLLLEETLVQEKK